MPSAPFTGATRLRELLKDPKKIVVCPGVFDGLTARIALSKGFDALYMVGANHIFKALQEDDNAHPD
jgi:2-methylisocitrate lyase-like PEP mutase family enzyme